MQHFRPYFDFIIMYTEHSTRFFTDLFRDVFADSYSHHSFILFVEAGFWKKKKKKQNPKWNAWVDIFTFLVWSIIAKRHTWHSDVPACSTVTSHCCLQSATCMVSVWWMLRRWWRRRNDGGKSLLSTSVWRTQTVRSGKAQTHQILMCDQTNTKNHMHITFSWKHYIAKSMWTELLLWQPLGFLNSFHAWFAHINEVRHWC